MPLTLSFDIGHASIGWCVLKPSEKSHLTPDILGTGVVTFPTNDCLASERRGMRRSRRHIRSTRQRIERLKQWLAYRNFLTREELDRPGYAAPFLLAAASLKGFRDLTAWELWTVLRWYAHNRGYDGNSRWANEVVTDSEDDDTKKELAARALMKEHGTSTMAETVCACLGLELADHDKRISSFLPYKTLDAAFPRNVVESEVKQLLTKYLGKITGLDAKTVRVILTSSSLSTDDTSELKASGIFLPKRFSGGLLFGQLVPRFDNRIISRCPITWSDLYDTALKEGKSDEEAKHLAERNSKVPSAKHREFFEYRFARILANLRANGIPLPSETRHEIMELARQRGKLTHRELDKLIRSKGEVVETNLEAYFKIHPDSEEALVLDPSAALVHSNKIVKSIWDHLPETVRTWSMAQWSRGRGLCPAQWLQQIKELDPNSVASLEEKLAVYHKKLPAKQTKETPFETWLTKPIRADYPSGRAPYAKPVLRRVVDEVLNGFDPNKPAKSSKHPDGEIKPSDGVLYPLLDPNSSVRKHQNNRPLDNLTNNHLVRHRLMILDRLVDDIVKEYCNGDNMVVGRVVVEVARELREFSGKTAKEITMELNSRLKDFKSAVTYLENNAPNLPITGSLIRKCRIAMDLNWKCPFTGEKYDACDLPKLEREHIIPYASRATNSLHAMVLTWPAVNRMKGKRTARQFILDDGSKPVDGMPRLSLFTRDQFDSFVDSMDTKGHPDDARRKRARKALLATTDFEDKELGFTEGQLTQSSHLMKLALRGLTLRFTNALCDPLPGPVTAEIRKAWNLTGTMALACPDIIDPDTNKPHPKDKIREITHLHHAVDAATIALAAHFFPLQARGLDQKGRIWEALLKRNRSAEQKEFLFNLGIFDRYQRTRIDSQGNQRQETDVMLRDLKPEVKEKLSHSLAECRVIQHIPADRSGTKAELNTWGVIAILDEEALILQRTNRKLLELVKQDPSLKRQPRRWVDKSPSKEAVALLAAHGYLLSPRQKSLVNRGICKLNTKKLNNLLGIHPTTEKGKLQEIKGSLVIGDNYGLALDPHPTIIPFHAAHQTIIDLQAKNHGRFVRVLRNGMLISVKKGTWKGVWKITSLKLSKAYGLSADLAKPDGIKLSKGNAKIPQMMLDGLEIVPADYTGCSSTL